MTPFYSIGSRDFWLDLASASGGGGGSTDDMIFISKSTASSSASLEITSGIDSTYDHYRIVLNGVQPATDAQNLQCQFSSDGSSYAMNVASAIWYSQNYSGVVASLSAWTGESRDNTNTGMNTISGSGGNDSTHNMSGWLDLYNPASTSLHKICQANVMAESQNDGPTGLRSDMVIYSTSVVTAVKFAFGSGNIAIGDFLLYGYKNS